MPGIRVGHQIPHPAQSRAFKTCKTLSLAQRTVIVFVTGSDPKIVIRAELSVDSETATILAAAVLRCCRNGRQTWRLECRKVLFICGLVQLLMNWHDCSCCIGCTARLTVSMGYSVVNCWRIAFVDRAKQSPD